MPAKETPDYTPLVRLLTLLAAWFFIVSPCHADSLWPEERQRLNVGIKLFPANLSAIENLARKQTDDGYLRILIVHSNDAMRAQQAAEALRQIDQIQALPLRVELVERDDMARQQEPVAGILVVTPNLQTESLQQWAKTNLALVFSPFSGDVERGATAGIYVTDHIRPYINVAQARQAQIAFKPFFLKVAQRHE